jgi:hypothetical protein
MERYVQEWSFPVDSVENDINSNIGMFDLFQAIREFNFQMNDPKHNLLKEILVANCVSKLDELNPNVLVIYLESDPPSRDTDKWNISDIKLMKVLSVQLPIQTKQPIQTKTPTEGQKPTKYVKVTFGNFTLRGILPSTRNPDKLTAETYDGTETKKDKNIQLDQDDETIISRKTFSQYYDYLGDEYFTMLFPFDKSTYDKIMAKINEEAEDEAIKDLLAHFNKKKEQRKEYFVSGHKRIEEFKTVLTSFENMMVDKPVSSTGQGGNKRSQKKPPKRCHINSKSHYYCHMSRTQRRKKTQRRQRRQRRQRQ